MSALCKRKGENPETSIRYSRNMKHFLKGHRKPWRAKKSKKDEAEKYRKQKYSFQASLKHPRINRGRIKMCISIKSVVCNHEKFM